LEEPTEGERPTRRAEECAVRYRKEHKQATRRRIIETAGRRFKEDGIDGSGITALMKDAGLTNGAFYTHFTSKDDLVATTIADQLQAQNASIIAHAQPGRAGLEQIVRWYLSPWHRDSRDVGCPSAALLDEIGRCTHPTKQAYTEGVLVVADGIAARLAPNDPLSVRPMALSSYAMMAGTLQLSRALADPQLADQVLDQGVHNALALLGIEHEGDTRTAH
jgi:AcrR family transcriptional regulator